MKVIDLLNKIANGEEVPKKIKYRNKVFIYDQQIKLYRNEEVSSNTLKHMFYLYFLEKILNDEIEIIEDAEEEEENKEIEKIVYIGYGEDGNMQYEIINKINELIDVVNELIDVVNELIN